MISSDKIASNAIAALIIVGFFGVLALLLFGFVKPPSIDAVGLMLSVLSSAFLALVFFYFGSSIGSRVKDDVLSRVVVQPPAIPPGGGKVEPQPSPSSRPAPSAPSGGSFTVTATVFGGPDDHEAKVAYPDVQPGWPSRPGVALPYHFPGVRPHVQVEGPSGKAICQIVDVGPWNTDDPYWQAGSRPQAESGTDSRGRHTNGAGIDLTPDAAKLVGIAGKGTVTWSFVGDAPAVASPVAANQGDPAWLIEARKEIGFHEQPNNTGIQKYVDLAGYGAEGDPWCSIFAGAMMKRAGVPISGINAMAQSWAHAPSIAKIGQPRNGAVAVFERGAVGSGLGHVGFYVGDAESGKIKVLGGNEDDQVEIATYATSASNFRLTGFYWPVATPKVT